MKRKREDLTYEEVCKLLSYDPLTGVLTWKVSRGTRKSGSVAGYVDTSPTTYRRIKIKGIKYYSHRLAFILMEGRCPRVQVDHIDHDGLNNKWINLREVSSCTNHKNMPKYSTNISGVTGVGSYRVGTRQKWRAFIQVEGKAVDLGLHDNFEDAIAARKAAEIKYGFHPNHGK